MEAEQFETVPEMVLNLRAKPHQRPAGIVLEWDPAPRHGVNPSKYYVIRLRVEEGSERAQFEKTHFLHASTHSFADTDLAPARYRYLVGALSPAGSGKAATVTVDMSAGS